MRRINLDSKRIATTLAAFVGGYIAASVVGFLSGTKKPFAVQWSGVVVGLAAFLVVSFAFGTFSRSADND
jgi:cyanate permease